MNKTDQLCALQEVLASLKEKQRQSMQREEYRVANALDETAQKLDAYIKKGQLRHAGKR